jgi:GNAT superfamily N-acetyltransferase
MRRTDEATVTVAQAAANLADWHHASVLALGWRPQAGGGWWTCPLPGPTIYHAAISLRPRARLRRLRALIDDDDSRYVSVCDSFADLDLTPLGRRRHTTGAWFARPPSRLLASLPAGPTELTIATVTSPEQLGMFETAMVRAFEVPMLIGRFDVHAPAILDDPAMTSLIGRVDGEPACVAMTYETADVIGVYGVGTVPSHRGHGYATALMTHLLHRFGDRPVILQPTPVAESLYARLGFTEIGRFVHWV